MKVYAIDWATKKDLTVYDGKKVKSIANTLDEFDKFLDYIGGSAISKMTRKSSMISLPPFLNPKIKEKKDERKTNL